MKNNVTKFDLNAAFKALDEIDMPKVSGMKNHRHEINESARRVDRLSMLIEDYYDINNREDMEAAKEDRIKDAVKAELGKIERIIDVDAKDEDSILISYVGKRIIQCPTCLNLFYKDKDDINVSEENPDLVNVGEACQHCGNDTGYTLIGKVSEDAEEQIEEPQVEESEEEVSSEGNDTEQPDEDLNLEEVPVEDESETEETSEEQVEETEETEETQEEDEEKKEESFSAYSGESLNEDIDDSLNKKLDEHNEYIQYLQDQIKKNEEALKAEKNEFVKASIQDCLAALEVKLDEAIPNEVKGVTEEIGEAEEEPNQEDKETSEEIDEEDKNDEEKIEECSEVSSKKHLSEDVISDLKAFADGLDDTTVSEDIDVERKLHSFEQSLPECKKQVTEDTNGVSDAEFADMLKNPLYYENLQEDTSDSELSSINSALDSVADKIKAIDDKYKDQVEAELAEEESNEDFDEITDESLNSHITSALTEVYSNVDKFEATSCEMPDNKLIVEGKISFKSGKSKNTTFNFEKLDKSFKGCNESFGSNNEFIMNYKIKDKTLIVEGINYKINVENNIVSGTTNK